MSSTLTHWTCQGEHVIDGYRIGGVVKSYHYMTFRSDNNQWAYAYGHTEKTRLLRPTLVIGFESEEECKEAMVTHALGRKS